VISCIPNTGVLDVAEAAAERGAKPPALHRPLQRNGRPEAIDLSGVFSPRCAKRA
jgi:hypothetical protein